MPTALSFATWNVNSLRLRLPQVLAWLEDHQPTALALQETKVEDGLFPTAALETAGWYAAFHGQKSYNGVAILAREPLQDITNGFATGYAANGQARLIAATVQGVRVLSAYVPNGESLTSEKFAFKEAFYAALQTEVSAALVAHPKLVLAGDFNIAWDERDVHSPARMAKEIGFSLTERQWLHTFAANTGLTDAFRQTDQTPNIYSWFDYRTYGRNPHTGMRIDYLFTSPVLTPAVKSVTHHTAVRGLVQPSDHVPVVVELYP